MGVEMENIFYFIAIFPCGDKAVLCPCTEKWQNHTNSFSTITILKIFFTDRLFNHNVTIFAKTECEIMLQKIPSFLKNKYFLTLLVFLGWLIFFDNNSLINQFKQNSNLRALERDKQYYLDEIDKDRKATHELMTNKPNLEKFGREQYKMKKDNEDIFIIVDEKNN